MQSRWELKSRIKAMEMLWNYLENSKKYREMLNKGWVD